MGQRVSLSSALKVREFRALWMAELLSTIGDQVARVSLAVLVFHDTGSAVLTGLTFALTYLPMLFGGLFLSGLGDRFSRREVMVGANVAQAILIGAMAVPGVPLWVLYILLALAVMATGPFNAAQLAVLPDLTSGDTYVAAMAIRNVTTYSCQLAGFAGGGLLLTAVDPNLGLAIDAVTFAVSALLLRTGLRYRPPAATNDGAGAETRSLLNGFHVIWGDRRTRLLIAIGGLALFYIAPEALAAPYAAQLNVGPFGVGLIMAADPVGAIVGSVIFARLSEVARCRSVAWLGMVAGAPLAICALHPPLVVALLMFAISGAAATIYTIQAMTATTLLLPPGVRAQGVGFGSAVIQSVQGIGALLAGILGAAFQPSGGIAAAGAAGVAVAAFLTIAWQRVARPYATLAAQTTAGTA
jgi:MFS family permease